jgi:G3E family GTPase
MIRVYAVMVQIVPTAFRLMNLQFSGDVEMSSPSVILVGGFLGAGKTTLLVTATERLAAQGKRVGLVTNDQAANLVDTALLKERDLPVDEVSGGCFCCKFDDLIGAMDHLVGEEHPDVLIGEPVGSCTDLSATVMQPMKALYRDRYRLAPLSVLVDPERVSALLGILPVTTGLHGFPDNVSYIFRKQLEEADLIVLNKVDLLSSEAQAEIENALRRQFPRALVMSIAAQEGTGVDAWLEHVTGQHESGRTVTEVDYDEYAEGEAALGWLNAAYKLEADPGHGHDWGSFSLRLMSALRWEFKARSAEIAHLKIHIKAGSSSLVANLTSSQSKPSLRGQIEGSPREARLLVNVRAHLRPDTLRNLVEQGVQGVADTGIHVLTENLECFAPSRPRPTHRYEMVVQN